MPKILSESSDGSGKNSDAIIEKGMYEEETGWIIKYSIKIC